MEYTVRKLETDNDSLIELTRYLKEVFPKSKKFSFDFVKWQYTQNPLGAMIGFSAWDGNRIISHFTSYPIRMKVFGKIRKGLVIINVSTNEKYRGKRLFTTLGEKTIEYAKESGYDFMIGVPNPNSANTFTRFLGFDIIASLTTKVGIGTNIYPAKEFAFSGFWDEAQLAWRTGNPTNKYLCNKRGVVSTPISYFFKTISKVVLPEGYKRIPSQNIGFRPFNLYIGLGADTFKGLYFNIPSFLKPHNFPVIFRDLTGGNIPSIKKEDLFLQLIDFDTI